MIARQTPINNPINLCLTQCHRSSVWTLSLLYENRRYGTGVIIIYDVTVYAGNNDHVFFIVPRYELSGNLYYDNTWRFEIPFDHETPPAESFEMRLPDFELCSPGFSTFDGCDRWWIRKNGHKNRWQNHIVLRIPFM